MADSLTIDQLAKQFFVSKYHLMHEFSQKTGTSVYRYLMQQWLHAVCELLEQGTVPNEAYLLCGFKDYANFYRAFRSAYGQSPREYARAHRKAAEDPRHQMHRKNPLRDFRQHCQSSEGILRVKKRRSGDQISIIPFSSFGIGSAIRRSTRANARPRPVQPTSR